MGENINEYEDKIQWNEQFERDGKRGLHAYQEKELIDSLIKAMGFNHELIGQYNDDTHLYSKHDKKKLPYKRIRDTADIIGVPPWLFFSEHEGNELIKKLYNSEIDPLPEYKISTVGDLFKSIEALTNKRELHNYDTDKSKYIINEFKKILSKYDFITEAWTDILKHIKSGIAKDSFDWAAHISLTKKMKESYRGTLRVFKKTNVEWYSGKKKDSVISIWLLLTPSEDFDYDDEDSYLIDRIKNDLCNLLNDKKYWTIETIETGSTWYGWHSHRTDVVAPQLVIDTFNDKVRQFNSGNLHDIHVLHYYIFQDSRKIIQITNKDTSDELIQGAEGTKLEPLKYLYTIGYIEDGTQLVITPYKSKQYYGTFENDDKRCFAKIVIHDNDMKLQWEFDGKMYGLNELNNRIIDVCKLSISKNRGSDFWMLENGSATLYEVAKTSHQAEGQMTLF